MILSIRERLLLIVACLLSNASLGYGQFFVANDFYTSNYDSTIRHYSSSGAFVNSITIPSTYGTEVKGMAAGFDGLMYVTVGNGTNGFNVLSLNSAGAVQQVYSGPEYVAGNLSYGKIAFSTNGQFFVTGQGSVRRFTVGNQFGNLIYTGNQMFDSTTLPSGNMLVLSAYEIKEITPSGVVVRTINSSIGLTDARGIAYNASTDDIYVSMLGNSAQPFRVMKLDGQTGQVEALETYTYADDLFITNDNRLLVGSRTSRVGIFDMNLNQTGFLTDDAQMFVTQFVPAPEPTFVFGSLVLSVFVYRQTIGKRNRK
jgi:hypothetical protein